MPDYAYISVIQWPAHFGKDQCVLAIVDATGMDPFHAGQRAAKGTPMVLNRMECGSASSPGPAEAAFARLRKHGAMVFGPTDSVMGRVAAPIRLRRIQRVPDAPQAMFMAEVWPMGRASPESRETHRGILAEDMFLIVRARVRQGSTGINTETTLNPLGTNAYGVGYDVETPVTRESTIHIRDVMDIYMRDGTRFRIDGSKFSFDGLGKDRGYSDNINADKTAVLLAESNRRVLIDTEFGSFNCPVGLVKGAGTWLGRLGRTVRDDLPLFEFYSVWAYLMYRAMARA